MSEKPESADGTAKGFSRWQFWIDRGGTFTDVVVRAGNGSLSTRKLLSQNPGHYEDAALQGIRDILGVAARDPIPGASIEVVKMSITVATNALLERTGEDTVLVTTKGFGDALRIGYQNRPRLFDLHIILPDTLYARVIEVDERTDADGHVVSAPDLDAARAMGTDKAAMGAGDIFIIEIPGGGYGRAKKSRKRK